MALDQLLAALERDAHAAADRALADARREAARIEADTERDIAVRRESAAGAVIAGQRAALEQELAGAGRRVRAEVLGARERLLARVSAAMRAALPAAAAGPAYRASLPGRIAAARGYLGPDEPVVLECPPDLARLAAPLVTADRTVSIRTVEGRGSGFRLATADGVVEVDDTLESRLASSWRLLARTALERLGLSR
ncbi:MAG TPA: hypothetical protein VFU45_05665 [Gemmatimonadales bacterium]|nr:hypothetical protein [Gemmatimonadales bacterium]